MEYRKAVKHIGDLMVADKEKPDLMRYQHVDISAILRSGGRKITNVGAMGGPADIGELLMLFRSMREETGMFLCRNKPIYYPESEIYLQNGVIRSNCIDCLDRTNNFQLIFGRELVKEQARKEK